MDAFAVPQRLFTGRKRRAEALPTNSYVFFTADDFHTFSIYGYNHKSRLYGELAARRQALVNRSTGRSIPSPKSSVPIQRRANESKHLVQLLVDMIENKRIHAPDNRVEVDNARRRISRFSVAEHEQYLALQRKMYQAQQVRNAIIGF